MKPSPINNKGYRRCVGYGPANIEPHWIAPPYTDKFSNRFNNGVYEDGLHEQCKKCTYIQNSFKNNPLGLTQKEKNEMPMHHLYHHIDTDGNIMYIGIGSNGRAFDYTLRRQPEHIEWLMEQVMAGRSPIDITKLIVINKTRSEVAKLEKEYIEKYNPIFNKQKKGIDHASNLRHRDGRTSK